MRQAMAVLVLVLLATGSGLAADASRPIPFRLVSLYDYSVTVKQWANPDDPSYSIITNVGEWRLAFPPAATMRNNRPFQPEGGLFQREYLLAISRVSDAPAQGERVLRVKSLNLVDGQVELTYQFVPPAAPASFKVINTLLLAIPVEYPVDGIHILEQIETAASLATQAGVEAARAAGRIKQP